MTLIYLYIAMFILKFSNMKKQPLHCQQKLSRDFDSFYKYNSKCYFMINIKYKYGAIHDTLLFDKKSTSERDSINIL